MRHAPLPFPPSPSLSLSLLRTRCDRICWIIDNYNISLRISTRRYHVAYGLDVPRNPMRTDIQTRRDDQERRMGPY